MGTSDTIVTTRRALHAVAEHVLAAARYGWDGHIGLRPTPAGFGTPEVDVAGSSWQVRVEEVDLVVEVDGEARRAPLTTLGAAADLVGIAPGAPVGLYEIVTPCDPGAPLAVDPGAAAALAEWFARCDAALTRFVAEVVPEPSETQERPAAQLWPEHFDVALVADEVNYGGSPGDEEHPEPYLYVAPWAVPGGPLWNEPWGVSWPAAAVPDVDTALALLREGRTAV